MTLQKPDLMVETFLELQNNITHLPTSDLVDVLYRLKNIHPVTKSVEEDIKKELRQRKEEGGKDARGNTYLAGKEGGIRIEPRRSYSFKPGAEKKLKEKNLLQHFPKEPDFDLMRQILRELQVPDDVFMHPVVSVAALADLVDSGIIDPGFAESLLDENVIYAIRNVEVKELPDAENSET